MASGSNKGKTGGSLALSDLGYSSAKAAEPPKVGCTKNSTRRIGTASSCGFVGNEEAAHSLGGLKAVMPRSSAQGLSDAPGSLHYSRGLLETSWPVYSQHHHKEAGVLMGQGSEVESWTNLRPRKEQPETFSTAQVLALACRQRLTLSIFL